MPWAMGWYPALLFLAVTSLTGPGAVSLWAFWLLPLPIPSFPRVAPKEPELGTVSLEPRAYIA